MLTSKSIAGVVGEELLDERVDRVEVGEVGRVGVGGAAVRLDLRLGLLELVLPRATSSGMPPAAAILSAAALPMPDEAPVITTVLPLTACSNERSLNRSGSRLLSQ